MDTYNDPLVREVWVMKCTQIGWTEACNNIIGYIIDRRPGPAMMVQPTVEMGEAWSKDRLATMLADTPSLRDKVSEPRAKSGTNTLRHKTGPGWRLTIVGANSPTGLRMRAIRDLFCDEVDGYPASAGAEGDPIWITRKRQVTYWNRKFYGGSTPTVKGRSRIETGFESTDMRYYFVPCPHCTRANDGAPDGFQRLLWEQLKWEEVGRPPREAAYLCKLCGSLIEHHEKQWMLEHGEWRATKPFDGRAGFHISELYSPFVSWGEMAENFLEAKKLPETLQTFVNTSLAETWEEKGETVEPEGLLARKEPYGPAELPARVLMLTVGGDTQDDRAELELLGWGADEECWIIEKKKLPGDPGDLRFWKTDVEEYLRHRYRTEDGRELSIEAACIDSGGHHTQTVCEYTGPRKRYRIWAIKGKEGAGRLVWPKTFSRSAKTRAPLAIIGVDTAKAVLYGRLERVKKPGPGFIHLPDSADEELCRQLTSEIRVRAYVHGRPITIWKPRASGIAQEAQDCWIYGYAAMLGRGGPEFLARRAMFHEERLRNFVPRPPTEQAMAAPAPSPLPRPAARVRRMRSRGIG